MGVPAEGLLGCGFLRVCGIDNGEGRLELVCVLIESLDDVIILELALRDLDVEGGLYLGYL